MVITKTKRTKNGLEPKVVIFTGSLEACKNRLEELLKAPYDEEEKPDDIYVHRDTNGKIIHIEEIYRDANGYCDINYKYNYYIENKF